MSATPTPEGRVVVVGGGVIGLSLAYHLAARGRTDVVVLERGQLGEGTTAKATGGIRQQFTSEINAKLVRRSVDLFTRFQDETGQPLDFRQHGYAFLLQRPADVLAFTQAVRMQNTLGIPSQLLSPAEVPDVFPGVRVDDLAGATYCPTDGSASPQDAVNGYATAARRLGVEIRTRTTVMGFRRDHKGRVIRVDTSDGTLDAGVVALAAGPQAREVGRLFGYELPVAPHRRQAFSAKAGPWVTSDLPLTVDLTSGAYLHPEGNGRLIVGGNDRNIPEGTNTSVDYSLTEPLIEALMHRFPMMTDVELTGGWAGLREMTPDDHAIVGPLDEARTMWALAGFSGHGFMQAPAIGEAVADLITKGVSRIDLSPLRASRFKDGALIGESVVF